MQIQLITGYTDQLGRNKKGVPNPIFSADQFLNIINNSTADIILFPGWTLKITDLDGNFSKKIFNRKVFVCFEVISNAGKAGLKSNLSCIIQNGSVKKLHKSQLFATSNEINEQPALFSDFLKIFETERMYTHLGRSIGIIVCGENNFLKNLQSEDNRVIIRTVNSSDKFKMQRLLDNTDIILNYTHVLQTGNQGKYKKRREFLSKNNKVYCSTTNFTETPDIKERKRKFKEYKTMQYCYSNQEGMEGKIIELNENYMIKSYEVFTQ